MLYQEATDARELVRLRRQHNNVEVEIGEILPRELEPGVVGVISINNARHFVRNTLLQGLDRVGVLISLAGGVVVRSHAIPLLVITHQPRSAAIVCRNPGTNANAAGRESCGVFFPPNFRHAQGIPQARRANVGC